MTTTRHPAEHEPIARVLPMLSVPHLDRDFDYLVSADQSDDAHPGVRGRARVTAPTPRAALFPRHGLVLGRGGLRRCGGGLWRKKRLLELESSRGSP